MTAPAATGRGRSHARAAASATATPDGDAVSIAKRSWRAIGTSLHVLSTEPRALGAAVGAVELVLADVDATYSRFRADSELRQLDLRPGRAARLSPLLAAAIAVALRAARLTDGAVDPTIGRAIRLLGYDDDIDVIRQRRGPLTVHLGAVPGWRLLRFDQAARTLTGPAGVELDLGSTGKALAADLAARAALDAVIAERLDPGGARGIPGVLVSLGGDIATAGAAPPGGWRILLAEDSDAPPDGEGEVVAITSGALATSSTTVRRWTRGGTSLHHLLDPKTGLPAVTPWRTASVVAASCVDANAAATATIVKGLAGQGWLERQGLPGRLVTTDGALRRVSGWPEPHGEGQAGRHLRSGDAPPR